MPKINQLTPATSLANTDLIITDTNTGSNTRNIQYANLRTQIQNESASVFAAHGEIASDQQVATAVGNWLDANVTPTGSAVAIDDTLLISGAAADAQATGKMIVINGTSAASTRVNITTSDTDVELAEMSDVNELKNALDNEEARAIAAENLRVNKPLDAHNQPTNGTDGQLLRTKGDGTTEWSDYATPTQSEVDSAVETTLTSHPEWRSTVNDGSLTEAKFSNELKLKTIKDYVTPEMFGAVGNGIADDTIAIQNAINDGRPVVMLNSYLVTETLNLTGDKIIEVYGTVINNTDDVLFRITGHFNEINGHNKGILTGGTTLIKIEPNPPAYSYYNKIKNIQLRLAELAIHLYNPETGSASYFNEVDSCVFIGCVNGIHFEGFADGNRITRCTFYGCGISDDNSAGCFVFSNIDAKYPMENVISQIFVTNAPNSITFLVNGDLRYNQFKEIIMEPGNLSRSFYSLDYTKIIKNEIDCIDLTYYGGSFSAQKFGNGNLLTSIDGTVAPIIKNAKANNPLYKTEYYYDTTQNYGENKWVPLCNVNIDNLRIVFVGLIPYFNTGVSFANQYKDKLTTTIFRNANGIQTLDTTYFKFEDGVLYFKTPPTLNGGTPFTGIYIEITIGTPTTNQLAKITMTDNWTPYGFTY